MGGFLSKIFGGKGSSSANGDVESLIRATLDGLFERADFDLDYKMKFEKDDEGQDQVVIEISGDDEKLIKGNDGLMIDSLQLFLKRVVQHNFPEDRTNILIDCDGFREESTQALEELAEKLKLIALEKGKSVYFRALPPRDRKIIHQYLAADTRVKSRSIGEGLFKKIKIYPAKTQHQEAEEKAT